MDDLKEFQNYVHLTLLLTQIDHKLRQLFRHRYQLHRGRPWKDTPENGAHFVKAEGKKVHNELQKIQKKMLTRGDLNGWDTTVLVRVLTKIDFKGTAAEKLVREEEDKSIHAIVDIRNFHSHVALRSYPSETFQRMWESAKTPFLNLNGDPQVLEEIQMEVALIKSLPIWFNVENPILSFTGRQDVLAAIHDSIQNGGITVLSQVRIISGMGGIGKTQTVRKYIQLYKHAYRHTLWITSETKSSLEKSFHSLAQRLEISTTDNNGNQIEMARMLHEIYMKLCRHVTLLIFDNAESLNGDNGAISEFLPKALPPPLKKPFVLVTSRNTGDWGEITDNEENLVSLCVFEDDEVVCFVIQQLKLTDNQDNCASAIKLGNLVGGLPLLLQQAVAFIKRENKKSSGVKFTIEKYVDKYEQITNRQKLLKFPPLDSPNVAAYTTFNITFDKIKELPYGENAIQIMNLMAILDPDNIPRDLLLQLSGQDEDDFEEGALLLKHYCLINTNAQSDPPFFSIHRIVQHVVLETLRDAGRLSGVIDDVIQSAKNFIEKIEPADPTYRGILNNLFVLTKHFNLVKMEDSHCQLQFNLAEKLKDFGWHNQSLFLLHQLEAIQKEIQAPKESLLKTQEFIGRVLAYQSKYAEAMKMYEQVHQERKSGDDDLLTLSTLSLMANLRKNEGKNDEALEMYQEVCQRQSKLLAHDDLILLQTRYNLAIVLGMLERHDEAHVIYLDVHKHQTKILGFEHRETLATYEKIGRVLDNIGRHEEGIQIYREVHAIRSKILGVHHPETLTSKNNIARVLGNQDKNQEAEAIYREVYDLRLVLLGADHYDTLTTKQNLARVLDNQEKYKESYQLMSELFEIRQRILPCDHQDLLRVWHNMARNLDLQRRFQESLDMYGELYVVRCKHLKGEAEHPETLSTRHNMGRVLERLGRLEEALEVWQQVYKSRSKVLGEGHDETKSTKECMEDLIQKMADKVAEKIEQM